LPNSLQDLRFHGLELTGIDISSLERNLRLVASMDGAQLPDRDAPSLTHNAMLGIVRQHQS
jgi:hypothetical protein